MQWVIEVSPVEGWSVPWEVPLYVGVVLVSLTLAFFFSLIQVSR